MDTANTITLEFLRTGGPGNQLISSLTPYLAVCENQEARMVHLPFDHHAYLLRQERLRYEQRPDCVADPKKVDAELLEMGQTIAGFLGEVPGLPNSFGRGGRQNGLIHLDLVFSALELSLVPFEATTSPEGCPGPGQPLSLQTEQPVAITRRHRASVEQKVIWWRRPKILVAMSSAGGPVPGQAHLATVRRAVEPWVSPDVNMRDSDNYEETLHVLPNATLDSIRDACAANDYTHIHILAHGAVRRVFGGERFGIALDGPGHRSQNIVGGAELASAIRTHSNVTETLSTPICVTLAVCDGGNTGTVIPPGGSVAQELHQAGIPLVIGSQFPLSSLGSVVLADTFYPRILKGDDPRVISHELRQRLRLLPGVHDWASVVVYFANPPTFDWDLRRLRIEQARRAGKVAIQWAQWFSHNAQRPTVEGEKILSRAMELLEKAAPETMSMDAEQRAARGEVLGLRGSLLKQRANIVRSLAGRSDSMEHQEEAPRWRQHERALLDAARREYLRGAQLATLGSQFEDWGTAHWLATQYLSLTLVLTGRLTVGDESWFQVAEISCDADVRANNPMTLPWAYASRTELALLSAFSRDRHTREEAWTRAVHFAGLFADAPGIDSFQLLSTTRQFRRYFSWFDDYLEGTCEDESLVLGKRILQDILGIFESKSPNGTPPDFVDTPGSVTGFGRVSHGKTQAT